MLPSWYFIEKFSAVPGMIFSLLGGMIVLHFMITEDSKEAHEGQIHLIMRRRHFEKLSEKQDP